MVTRPGLKTQVEERTMKMGQRLPLECLGDS